MYVGTRSRCGCKWHVIIVYRHFKRPTQSKIEAQWSKTRLGRRNDHSKEELRALCISAAQALVAEHGLGGLTARRIAQGIGYSAGSLYVVFANLDDIIVHVNAATLAQLHAQVAPIPATHSDPHAAIHALATSYLEFAQTHTNLWRCIFEHRLPGGVQVPPWFLDRVAQMFKVVAEPIGQVRPDFNEAHLSTAARALWSAVHGVCILGLDDKLDLSHRDAVTEVLGTLVEIYVAGLSETSAKAKF